MMDLEKEVKRYKGNTCAINEDIIFFEILTRLPVASLLRCKAVCKSWYSLTSDPCFVATHLDRSRKKRKLALVPVSPELRTFKIYGYEEGDRCFPSCIFQKKMANMGPWDIKLVHNSNGLLLVVAEDESFICNPSTRDYTILPEGGHNSSPYPCTRSGFGFVPGTNVAKIAQYFYRSYNFRGQGTYSLGFEVFTLGVDSSWRVMAKDPPYLIAASFDAISAGGAVYFKIHNARNTASPEYVLSFDLKDEEFTVIHPPPPLNSVEYPQSTCRLMGVGDGLGFVYLPYGTEECNVWIYREHTWILSFTFQLPNWTQGYYPRTAVGDKKILFRVFGGCGLRLKLFDTESKSFETVAHITGDGGFNAGRDLAFDFFHVFSYVESLEPVRTMKKKIVV